ncbi:PadR family transcriptional regulator [Kribbella sp. VKM Ac-2568]|uniref:PadR family transcriptional regulator n=1 Tax=Kribbella sp. VKM Ac-2568 TaxID=2512219 RepID=UPI00104502C5|nr:PadR family transcriptional regulator [Kribbella sp. VKM Ac-2568]TCM45019.1 DNA-binding PadR family transcriptional regulator [Kribbella sp. VKM Ac-2568]
MGLRHAVLASLLEGDAAGYELSKRFDVSVANFWSATPQQLYRELERLESEGFVEGRVVEQQRRPNKRVFALTPAGRAELRAFIAQPTRPGAMRDDLLVKVQAAGPDDLPAVRKAIEERRQQAREKLAFYDHLHDGLLDGRTDAAHLAEAERVGPYLTLMGGRLYEQANIHWCESVLAVLDERSPVPDGD